MGKIENIGEFTEKVLKLGCSVSTRSNMWGYECTVITLPSGKTVDFTAAPGTYSDEENGEYEYYNSADGDVKGFLTLDEIFGEITGLCKNSPN
jgi:hypothetical protein